MSLTDEVEVAKHDIVTDGYEMSLGELISLYKDEELIINPVFQRYFRWSSTQKTRFIESLLLGIPIPPIFVYQNEDGIWELIDGLQRLSSVFEFTGVLRNSDGELVSPSIMEGTKLLPSLSNTVWEESEEFDEDIIPLERVHQLEIKRARMRVEILKKESDPHAKYELFQRLNTGGSILTEQEVRNAVLVMINEDFYHWLVELSEIESFINTVRPTDRARKRQTIVELVLRFFAYRNFPYEGGFDVHEYLDQAALELTSDDDFDQEYEEEIFRQTFDFLDETFQANTGAGVRGTTRLTNLLTIAPGFFQE